MNLRIRAILIAILLAGTPLALAPAALSQNQGVIVVADDLPITQYDITQKRNLLKVLGSNADGVSSKEILRSLINDVVKLAEARRLKVLPGNSEVDGQIGKIAKNMKLDSNGLLSRLKERGVATEFFRRYVAAQMGFNRVVGSQSKKEVKVTDADVDRKMAEIKASLNAQMNKAMADPRMKPITVLQLLEIDLPVESDDPGLLQARAIEAQQVMGQFKGCKNAKAAAAGVFNVRIGKTIEADAAKVPAQLRQALTKAGPGRAIGPMRGPRGLQVIGYCGTRKIVPPKPKIEMPTREQVENSLVNEKYVAVEEEFLKEARKRVYIEYRDKSFAQQ